MMEVGALLVGKIVNHSTSPLVQRGQEKGYFRFGGSTVVLLLQKDTVKIDSDIINHSQNGYETVVKYGERIGVSLK
jgi:phosphatidylserine decarboxylase